MPPDFALSVRRFACLLATLAGLFALATLAGYAFGQPDLISVRPGLQAMSPLTACMLVALAGAVLCVGVAATALARAGAMVAGAIAVATLACHAVMGADDLSPVVAAAVFQVAPDATGRTSVATGLSGLLLALAAWFRRARPGLADPGAGLVLVISGTALLGYAYGVDDLYAVPLCRTMALNTALALIALSLGTILVVPESGWAAVFTAPARGENFTRCMLAFVAVAPILGAVLVMSTRTLHLGVAAAMAMMVVATTVPLALLVLRDGRLRIAFERGRQERIALQRAHALELEARLAEKTEELRRETVERAKAEEAMHQAQRLEAVGQLTGGIAHDFNNLLQALSGNVSLLKMRIPEGDPSRKFVDNAARAVDKGAKLTNQLLAFSRSQRLAIRPVLVRAAMQDAHELIRHSIGAEIGLEVDLPGPELWVQGDSNQLELALVNLALNARDAMPGGGHLRISTRETNSLPSTTTVGAFVVIAVQDTGTGMPPAVAARAVEPFFTTKPPGKGTGLGLAQAYAFARQCGGDLRIDSVPGKGTLVEIILPRAQAELPPRAAVVPGSAPGAEPPRLRNQILVIDDDESVRSVIAQGLVDAGYDVLEANDGVSGLRQLESAAPAVAVIDFLMPGMNGAEVARRAQARRPGLPIVFVSGYGETVVLDGIAGAVVLRKPFDLDGLRSAVATALR